MLDAHAHVMQVKLCKANTRGVTTVQAETLTHRDHGVLPTSLWLLVDRHVPTRALRGRALAGVKLTLLR